MTLDMLLDDLIDVGLLYMLMLLYINIYIYILILIWYLSDFLLHIWYIS